MANANRKGARKGAKGDTACLKSHIVIELQSRMRSPYFPSLNVYFS